MNIYNQISLILFLTYQPFIVAILLMLKNRIKGYTIRHDVISILGAQKFPYGFYFNTAIIVYGLLALSLPLAEYSILENTLLNKIAIIALINCCTALIFAGIFPMHTKKVLHLASSYFVFGGIFAVAVTHALIFYKGVFSYSTLIGYSLIVSTVILVLFFTYLNKKLAHSLPEWLSISFAIIWNSTVTMLIIFKN